MIHNSQVVVAAVLMSMQGGPKNGTVLRVDNFVTISGKKMCDAKSCSNFV